MGDKSEKEILSEEKKKNSGGNANSSDLNDLLDSCLDDFNKPLPAKQTPTPSTTLDTAKDKISESKNPKESSSSSAAWSEEFNDAMGNLVADESGMEELRKIMDNLSSQEGGMPFNEEDFAKSFSETIRELTEQTQNLPEPNPEDLASLLGNLGIDQEAGGAEGLPDLMPLVQNVMHKLMSKELLYPSIKEIVDKYPEWLSANGGSLKKDELENYKKQHELMQTICIEFEKDDGGSEEVQREQFEKVLLLMQKVQSYGNPPKELVSNIGPGVSLDDHGNLQIPGMPQQCTIM